MGRDLGDVGVAAGAELDVAVAAELGLLGVEVDEGGGDCLCEVEDCDYEDGGTGEGEEGVVEEDPEADFGVADTHVFFFFFGVWGGLLGKKKKKKRKKRGGGWRMLL